MATQPAVVAPAGPQNPVAAGGFVGPQQSDTLSPAFQDALKSGKPVQVGNQSIPAPAVVSSGNAANAVTGLKNNMQGVTDGIKAQANQPYDAATGKTWDAASASYNGPVSPNYQGNGSTPAAGQPPATPEGVTTVKNADGSFNYVPADQNNPSAVASAAMMNLNQNYLSQIQAPLNTMKQIQNGTYVLNAGEQAQLDAIKQMITQQLDVQNKINNYELGQQNTMLSNAGGRYGGSSNVAATSDLMNAEAQKVSDIQAKGAALLAQTQQALLDNDFSRANNLFKAYQDAGKQQSDSITAMLKISTDAAAAANDSLKTKIAQQAADTANFKAQQTFNKDNNVTGRFYQYPGSSQVFDSITGQPVTQAEYTAAGGKGGDYKDIQVLSNAPQLQSTAGKEWQDYISTLPAGQKPLSFNDYQTQDVNRKAKIAASGAAKTYNELTSQAETQAGSIIGNTLANLAGAEDKYVSPKDWKTALQKWTSAGYDADNFYKKFSNYLNPADIQDYGITK